MPEIIEKTYNWAQKLSKRGRTDYIVLHHADAKTCGPDDVHRWHLGNGWAGIGYHYFIRKDGSIYRGRPEDTIGAQTQGYNNRSIGVCFEGDYDREPTMPEAQKRAGQELVSYLKAKYPNAKVVGHRDLGNTACPGTYFPFVGIASGAPAEKWEWKKIPVWIYANQNGQRKTGWLNDGGKWYFLGADGIMQTGWVKDGKYWYYLGPDGAMLTGWQKIGGEWYYLDGSGKMLRGWQLIDGKWYFMDGNGVMKTGWVNDNGKWYFLGSDGVMVTGWLKDGGDWYYLKATGEMAVNEWIGEYYVGSDGKWVEGKKR